MIRTSDILLPVFTNYEILRWFEFNEQIGWDLLNYVTPDSVPADVFWKYQEYVTTASKVESTTLLTCNVTLANGDLFQAVFKGGYLDATVNNQPVILLLKTKDCKDVTF